MTRAVATQAYFQAYGESLSSLMIGLSWDSPLQSKRGNSIAITALPKEGFLRRLQVTCRLVGEKVFEGYALWHMRHY